MFGNVAAYMRDVEKIYESISAVDVPARGSPLVYVGGRLSAPWHFDASKKPQALAKPGHLHMKGHAMRVMSVVGQYDLPLYDPKEDASQLIRFEDVAKMRTDPNVKTTEIEMRQGDLLIFTDECLHISGAVPGETELKLRESLGMFEIQMPQIATPPALLQPAYLPHQSRTLA